jgi:UDP-N-acetylmuramate--alanine ligase
MVDLKNIKHVYFLGIGGIGMSALARYFRLLGIKVSGYDRTSTPLTDQLIREGMLLHFEENVNLVPNDIDLVIITPAIPKNHSEYRYLKEKNIPIKKRAEILGEITADKKTVAVSGTHGKTTVSTMIAHILNQSKVGCNAFLGGISKNYNTNFISSEYSEWAVAEADEFDRSFMHLTPFIEIITSMDADHLDIYGNLENLVETFEKFAGRIKPGGILLTKKGLNLKIPKHTESKRYSYSLAEETDFYISNIRNVKGKYIFNLVTPDKTIPDLKLGIPGLLNVENAVVAIAASLLAGANEEEIRKALAGFTGIKRRFEIVFQNEKLTYIDDYAHHPEEITKTILSVRDMYPDQKILGIFQPHLYSRTRDFAIEFAKSLDLLDETILLPIYPAREEPIEGVSSEMIEKHMNNKQTQLLKKSELTGWINQKTFDILLTMGAGDIDQLVDPIKEICLKKSKSEAL